MSLVNTRMQNLRAKSNLDKNELRPSRYGGLDLFMQQTEDPTGIITQELKEKAMASIGQTLETPVIDYDGGVTIGNTRSVTIADSENTSQMYQISFTTYAWGFTIIPANFKNQEISMQQDFERKFNKYLNKFASDLDTAAIASLVAAKTQVFADSLNYTVTGNKIIAPWKLRENVIGDVNPMLAANDHFDQIHLLGNAGAESIIRKLAESGIYNAENKQLQYSDKIIHLSTRLANAAGEFANMIAVNAGSVGMLFRHEREALLGTTMQDGTSWDIDTLPMLNMPIDTYFYESKGDYSAIAGAASADMTRVRKEHYGFAIDIAFVTCYNSDPTTIANPIMAVAINDEAASDIPQVVVANDVANPVYTQEVV